MQANNIVDITLENFQQIIIEASQHTLVVVDFWAEWCEPCKDLLPILEKLAHENSQHLILARIDCEAQPQIVQQFGVQSLPTVALIKNGQPVDGFTGVQPESVIRELLQKHLPKIEDELFAQAQQALANNDIDNAIQLCAQAHQADAMRADIKFLLIQCYLDNGQIEEADTLLATVGLVDQDSQYKSLMARLELAKQAADTPEIKALQEQLDQQPDNEELLLQLCVQLDQVNRTEEALEAVFKILNGNIGHEAAKKLALDIINARPSGDPLAAKFRRRIFSLMY